MNSRGFLSRRHLIRLGAAASLAPVLVQHSGMASAARSSARWTPEDGLRLAGPVHGVASLDPALARDLETNFIARQLCRGLVGYDRDLNPVPELADVVDIAEDHRVFTFALRPNARFHDGRPIEAADVRHSLSRALDPAIAGGDASALPAITYLGDIVGAEDVLSGRATGLDGVEVMDVSRVRITLREPSSTFLMKLAAVPCSILDHRQAKTESQWWLTLHGSGPFRLSSVDPVSRIALRATAAWRGRPVAVPRVSIRLGAAASLPVNLFQAGEIDLVPEVPPQLVSLVADSATGDDDASLIEMPQFAVAYIAFGNQRPPLDDVHVRRALQQVFPAYQLAGTAYDGRVLPATGVIPPGMLGAEWDAGLPDVDIAAARAEIGASRYGRPEDVPPIRIRAADVAPVEALRDVVERDLGLRVEVVQVPWYDFIGGLSARRWDAYSIHWGADYPDPEALLWMLFGSDSSENYTGYANPEFDRLLTASRAASDVPERRELYARAQRVLIDDAAVIPLYFPIGYTLARTGLTEVPVTPMGLMGLETIS